jgi:hypothetical protein
MIGNLPMTSAVAWRTVVLAVAVALLPACRSTSRAEGPTATLGTAPPITTTSTTNPYAVPAVIDAAYVNRVLAGLDAAMGDTVRLVIRTRTIPPEALDRIRAIFSDTDRLQRAIDGFQRDIRENFVSYKANPGNKHTVVTRLVTAGQSCIFAEVHRDYSAVGTNPSPVNPQWIILKPLESSRDPRHYNPTPWTFAYDGFEEDLSQPKNLCAS